MSTQVYLTAEEAAPIGTFLAQDLGTLDQTRIVDNECAAFAATEVLGLVEALRGQDAERAQGPRPIAPQ
jgi:hypothetical protein